MAKETGREENNLENKELIRMNTIVASGTSYGFEFFREKDMETLEIWEVLKV